MSFGTNGSCYYSVTILWDYSAIILCEFLAIVDITSYNNIITFVEHPDCWISDSATDRDIGGD